MSQAKGKGLPPARATHLHPTDNSALTRAQLGYTPRGQLASLCQKFSSYRLRIYVALRDHGGGGIFEENDGGVDKEVSVL